MAIRTKDVPQDEVGFGALRRGEYALDERGRYTVVPSTGWEVERTANEVAVRAVERDIALAWRQVREGRKSPLAYHLARAMITPAILADAVGMWRFRVGWHLRPAAFARLSPQVRARYAQALGLTVEELDTVPDQPAQLGATRG